MKFIYLLLFIVFCSCSVTKKQTLQEGDLLFQDIQCGELCNAIEAVTEGVDGRKFSHCALVIKDNDSLKVIEAIGNHVQKNSLQNFFKRTNDTGFIKNIVVGRVKNNYKNLLPTAIDFAKQQIGKPYDDEFILNNNSWYCSELLYESFKKANNDSDFFLLSPMTFKNPQTQQFFPAWIQYYKDINKEIPEGKLGLNPGSISRDKKIDIIKLDKISN